MRVPASDEDYVDQMIYTCENRINILEDTLKMIPPIIEQSWARENLGYADKLLSLNEELEKWKNHESQKYR